MPTNIGAEGAKFNTLIPEINENADIQTAFRLYHYGEGLSGTGTLPGNSLAGFLDKLENEKVSKVAEIIPANADLNTYTTPGFYSQNTDPKARSGVNYPLSGEVAYAGMLKVLSDGNNVYQEYQIGSITSGGRTYWRARFGLGGTFTQWRAFAFENHTHPQYISRTEAINEFVPQIRYKTRRNVQSTRALTKADEDTILLVNFGSTPGEIIIPQDIAGEAGQTQNIEAGTRIVVIQTNNGQVTFTPQSSSVSINSTPGNKTRTLWSVAILVKTAANSWILYGDLEDSRTRSQKRNDIGIYVQPNEPTVGVQDGDLWFW